MSNKLATVTPDDITFEVAKRALLFRGLSAKIAKVCRLAQSQVWRVLNEDIRSGEVREKVIPVAARLVRAYEKKHNISIGGGN